MEKKIVLTMLPSKDIDVVLNNSSRMIISKDDRTVKADAIYDFLGYERGDIFEVESVNAQNLDAPVLQFFTELINDITDRLNRLSDNQSNDEDEIEFEEMSADRFFVSDKELPFS